MQAVSSKFLAAIRNAHAISLAAWVYSPSAPTTAIPVSIVGGSLTLDVDAFVRRQATLDIAFSLRDPVNVALIRQLPFGGFCKIERGVRYADGSVERVPLGYFRIESVVWPDLQGTATLTLADRFAQVNDEALTVPYVASGKKPSDAVVELVQGVFGGTIAYHVLTNPATESALADTVYDEDRGDAVRNLASGVGAVAYFDPLGDFVLKPAPDGTGASVWTVDTGATGVLVSASESLDRSSVRNGVSVRAQPSAEVPPLYSLATDDDPASPTRWGGPFGHVALVVQSQTVATQAGADSLARSLLNLRLGLSRTLELHAVTNPALEGGDVLTVNHADGRTETALVNALAFDLGPEGDLAVTTRTNWRPNLQAAQEPNPRFYRAGVPQLAEVAS